MNSEELALEMKHAYDAEPKGANILLYGPFGSGKTWTLATARRPLLIHSFDPRGTRVASLRPGIEDGSILVERFEEDDAKKPFAYAKWERRFEQLRAAGFFNHIATYAIDSATMWAEAMLRYAGLRRIAAGGRPNPIGLPAMEDYGVQQKTIRDIMGVLLGLPCDVIMTGHVVADKNELTGQMVTGLAIPGKGSQLLFIYFDEVWFMRPTQTSSGVVYRVQTYNDGMYQARTRIGGGIFEPFEEPNIRELLAKAGLESGDLPPIIDRSHVDRSTDGKEA